MKSLIRLLGIILLVAGYYWLAEDSNDFTLGGDNTDVGPRIVSYYDEAITVNYAAVPIVKIEDQEMKFNDQWNYIFSDPTYLLIVAVAVFLNIVLLRKLIKKEL